MSNHWHLVAWPQHGKDRQVSEFLRWLPVTHAQRWRVHRHTLGTAHLHQGRFKSFPVELNKHLDTYPRSVERKPMRANLEQRAQDWRWSSARRRHRGDDQACRLVSPWPITRPSDWLRRVNRAEGRGEIEAALSETRPAAWQRALAPPDHCAARPRIDLPSPSQDLISPLDEHKDDSRPLIQRNSPGSDQLRGELRQVVVSQSSAPRWVGVSSKGGCRLAVRGPKEWDCSIRNLKRPP